MELAKQIEVAPKNGDFIVLQDTCSWEVGRWAPEANGWVQPDGIPVRISPTHWTPLPDDVAGATDRERLLFLAGSLPDDEAGQTQKRPHSRLIMTLVIAIFCIGGLVFWIGSEDSGSGNLAADPEREFSQRQDRAYDAIGDLTAARKQTNVALTEALDSERTPNSKERELKQALDESEARSNALDLELASARENDAAARNRAATREHENAALVVETQQIADAKLRELKQALDESEARSNALDLELASARENNAAARNRAATREHENAAQVVETQQIADAKLRELKQALDESEKRALALERELMGARATIASAEKPSTAEVTARDATAPTEPLNRPMEGSNAVSEIPGSTPPQGSSGIVTAGLQASSEATPDDATAHASGRLTQSDQSQHGQPQPPNAMSPAEEAKLVARADALIKRLDFASARLLLAHALEKGSARAALMMAETYDWQILRPLRAYGLRGDAQKAREFYQLAAAAGIEKARERLEALQSGAKADTRAGGE